MPSKHYAEIIHMWLWWSVFECGRRTGHGVVASFKAAQSAAVKLYE